MTTATIDDLAEQAEARDREMCMSLRMPEVVHSGVCLECGDPAAKMVRESGEVVIGAFCSPECRDTWQQREKFNRGMER